MSSAVKVKICGVRTLSDAKLALACGADLLGFNLIEASPRYLPASELRRLLEALREAHPGLRTEFIGVVADRREQELRTILAETGLTGLQLHGFESENQRAALGDVAYKAVRIQTERDVSEARRYGGRRLLVDAKVDGQLGGTGVRFDWDLVSGLATERELILAGGLTPGNVAEAVRTLRPSVVDVASGVERSPGVKDGDLMKLFVQNAKSA